MSFQPILNLFSFRINKCNNLIPFFHRKVPKAEEWKSNWWITVGRKLHNRDEIVWRWKWKVCSVSLLCSCFHHSTCKSRSDCKIYLCNKVSLATISKSVASTLIFRLPDNGFINLSSLYHILGVDSTPFLNALTRSCRSVCNTDFALSLKIIICIYYNYFLSLDTDKYQIFSHSISCQQQWVTNHRVLRTQITQMIIFNQG